MNKFNKRLASFLIPMVLGLSSAVLADIPNGTVVIGNKAYDLKYANDYKNINEIKNAISESGNNIFVKLNNSKWFSNKSSKKVDEDIIPKVIYKDALGKEYDYEKGDGKKINLEITSASFISSNRLIVNFNKKMSKESLEKDNFNISGDTKP